MTAVFSPRIASLDERYQRQDGTVYLTGIQALVRMLLDRARHDREHGLATAGYVSGYEGSPLGGYDLELARQRDLLSEYGIVHQPGLNEELAATSVSGTQLAGRVGDAKHDGVTGVWYGKAPGLDRATDALRHANMIGTSPTGGAVALVGDDPAAKSSTLPCSSEMALAGLALPTFYPADPAEALVHGLHAVELSRASGLWSAMKIVTAMADGATTAQVSPHWQAPDLSDLHSSDQYRGLRAYGHQPRARLLGAELAELERSQQLTRLPVALEYIRRSGLNVITGPRAARIGLLAAGKTYLDVRQALTALGLTEADLERQGIRLLRLGVIYPVEPSIVAEFAAGLDEIVVIEDKRAFLEDAVKSALYGRAGAPPVYGKRSRDGSSLFAAVGELDSDSVAEALARHLEGAGIPVTKRPPRERVMLPLAQRMPYFCSGCPHNSSTKVAPGTLVGGGIGCHAMVAFMPPEQVGEVIGLCQMGGEGAQWMGIAPFVTQRHLVQNLGDGTFAHSGSLAIRAAVASGVNITFKLLRNSAVAMTGGQQAVGELPVDRLLALLAAEGVRKTVVTTDDPARLRRQLGRRVFKHSVFKHGADIRHRDDLIDVQRELAAIDGVTVLVHDQECAAEKRRKRRRGKMAVPAQRAFINERVCEGCGDCGRVSNCLSVQPVATEFGRKTRIHQSSCNLDFSCLNGDCPSFLSVTPAASPDRSKDGGSRSRPGSSVRPGAPPAPAEPEQLFRPDGFTMRVTGVGGTGVVTIAQILGTAFAADGYQVRSLDQTGLAQKGGAVVSDLSVSTGPAERSAKLGHGECDLYLGCDSLVATDGTQLRAAGQDRTVAVVSTTEVPTGQMVTDVSQHFPAAGRVMAAIEAKVRSARFLDAAALATDRFGDEQFANMILVGAAYQAGALPVSAAAIEHAIRLNGVAADANVRAFLAGRMVTEATEPEPAAAAGEDAGPAERSLADVLALRVRELTAFQDQACADEYASFVEHVRAREAAAAGGETLARTVAENLYKLTAYKDEYEVARLSLDPALDEAVRAQFGDGARYQYRLHPPVLRALGLRHKVSLGPWFRPAFATLVAMRRLRGTRLDPFGYTEVRRTERALIGEYREVVDALLAGLTPGNHDLAVEVAALPDMVRGYEDIKLATVPAYREKLAELRAEFAASAAPTLVP
jgi:indolepyruvate ferredoxin oxidoreductase